jgi:hypothetical protein
MHDRQDNCKDQSAPDPSRREFLARAGIMAGGLALFGLAGLRPASVSAAVADQRGYASAGVALELDGAVIDTLRSAEGGFPKADVIPEMSSNSPVVKKHIGPIKFQHIIFQCDPVMPKPLFDWIAATLTMNLARKNGAIITTDFNRVEKSRLQFNNALITEIGFPACDAGSKEAGYLTIKLTPEFTTLLSSKGSAIPMNTSKTQRLTPGNFRLTIPGLDCSRVSKIDAFTVKHTSVQDSFGTARDFAKELGKLDFPNLVISVPEVSAGTFYSWFQDMVVKGNAGENNERVGTLEFLDQAAKSVLLTITFHHLGIFGFTPENAEANRDAIKRVRVEMYCEQITLAPAKGVA